MGQDQAGMFEPQLPPKQQVEVKWAWPPALLSLPIAAAAQFQSLEVFQQLQCCQLRRWTLNTGEQKNGVAVRVLTWAPPNRLGRQEPGTTHISSIGITPVHKKLTQARCNPTQRGFGRANGAT